jgi:AbrB family looped-hinge helix DNA binding protein
MATKVTKEGQVTIPKWVQDQLGGPGSYVSFRLAMDGSVVLEKAEAEVERRPSGLIKPSAPSRRAPLPTKSWRCFAASRNDAG